MTQLHVTLHPAQSAAAPYISDSTGRYIGYFQDDQGGQWVYVQDLDRKQGL
ncbi:MAG: hypothetical protein KKA73_08970 [Chloroflexi bacterium]|nr:hypothetical protein [Chloroflexota bacterium]MBU1747809.1 hypothetical protein [Chloroflexota bacterium]